MSKVKDLKSKINQNVTESVFTNKNLAIIGFTSDIYRSLYRVYLKILLVCLDHCGQLACIYLLVYLF